MPVSVLIVTRNRPDFLRFVLSQLAERVRPEDEVIVIDDGSEVSAEPAVEVLDEKCHCRFVRHAEHSGYIARRNQGIQMANHECILQLDDDSWPVEADALVRCEHALQDHPDVGAFALPIHYHWSAAPDGCGSLSKRWQASHLARECALMGCGVVLRRSAVQSAGLYPDYYGYGWEETALSQRLYRTGWATRMHRGVRVIHGHDVLSAAIEYNRTRTSDARRQVQENKTCLAFEGLCWPLNVFVGWSLKHWGLQRSDDRGRFRQELQFKMSRISGVHRLGFLQTLGWLQCRTQCQLRRLLSRCDR